MSKTVAQLQRTGPFLLLIHCSEWQILLITYCSCCTTVSTYISHKILYWRYTFTISDTQEIKNYGSVYGSCILCLHYKRTNGRIVLLQASGLVAVNFCLGGGKWFVKVWNGGISGVKLVGLISRVSLVLICWCQCKITPQYLILSQLDWVMSWQLISFLSVLISAHSMMNLVAK